MAVGIPMVVEHIIPLVANGPSTINNLCLACYRCNEFKGLEQRLQIPTTDRYALFFTLVSNSGGSILPGAKTEGQSSA